MLGRTAGRGDVARCNDSRLAARCSLLVVRGSRLAARGSLLVARCARLAARGSRLAARGSLLVARCARLAARRPGTGYPANGPLPSAIRHPPVAKTICFPSAKS
ncbi:oxidoreductase [Pseudoclavibacter chungangensis]|uniref:Oxidoreductase n=1 Tax=Pseudoclavibacter chungangensis TaxID=587635 RepID=A0A7J5BSE3_9MICO|nr:oxidoreductase [Pseudoclavibacter chungangensis]